MAETVRCDVCGGLFSARHLNSHKRLAHANRKITGQVPGNEIADGDVDEQDAIRRIVDLFGGLSEENKKNVLSRLTTPLGKR
jgi:hypothetical protein